MLGLRKSEAIGRKWRIGILTVIGVAGALFLTFAFAPPAGSTGWLWGFALLFYIPFVLVGAGVLKWVVLVGQRLVSKR